MLPATARIGRRQYGPDVVSVVDVNLNDAIDVGVSGLCREEKVVQMQIELQSDLILSDFWRAVRTELAKELEERDLPELLEWKIIIRPMIPADDAHMQFPEEERPFPLVIRDGKNAATIAIPLGTDHFVSAIQFPKRKRARPDEVAMDLADDLQLQVEEV